MAICPLIFKTDERNEQPNADAPEVHLQPARMVVSVRAGEKPALPDYVFLGFLATIAMSGDSGEKGEPATSE